MAERVRVVVYGRSLNMAGLAASLQAEAGLDVVGVHPDSPTARQRLNELNPAVIVFDLSDPASPLDVAVVRERPGLLLIGLESGSDELLVLSSRAARALTIDDLLQLIEGS